MKYINKSFCVFVVLLLSVVGVACGQSKEENRTANEEVVISEFYQVLSDIYEKSKSIEFSITNETESLVKVIESFEGMSMEDELTYKSYFDTVTGNEMYQSLKTEFVETQITEEDFISQTKNRILVKKYIQEILEMEIPFENEMRVVIEDPSEKEIVNEYLAIQNQLIKAGEPVKIDYSGNSTFSFPSSLVEYTTASGRMQFYPELWCSPLDDEKLVMQFVLHSLDSEYSPLTIVFSNGTYKAELNSAHIISFYTISGIKFYSSAKDPSMNEEYYVLKDMFKTGESITVSVDDNVEIILDQNTVREWNIYFELMDVLMLLFENQI